MTLEERIRKDLKQAILDKDDAKKGVLRMIIGEIPRLNKKAGEKATDNEIEKIIRKLIKSELQVLDYSGMDSGESEYVNTLEKYLPRMMTTGEVILWIADNVNIDDYDPPIKAMGPIMKELRGKADGNIVRGLLK